jgi:membrane-associated phospholipid phosphatase
LRLLPLRPSEWLLLGFFFYVALLSPFFRDRPGLGFQPLAVIAISFALLESLSLLETRYAPRLGSMIRDWMPIAFTLVAFREMELFVAVHYNTSYEGAWIRWDQVVINEWHLRSVIEAAGSIVPLYLELCYLLVYGLAAACVAIVWIRTERRAVDRFYVIYLAGTLLAYALFPFFPSRPPRIAYPELGMPTIHTAVRTLNLFLLRKATIHVGVFPSAHVSSAFSAAWGLFLVLPRQHRAWAWIILVYAASVSVATVYGRYHYVPDVVAGFGVSLVAAALCGVYGWIDRKRKAAPKTEPEEKLTIS